MIYEITGKCMTYYMISFVDMISPSSMTDSTFDIIGPTSGTNFPGAYTTVTSGCLGDQNWSN